jgi:hypothetical protein
MIAVEELERRMRPGAWSEGGFLGHRERLEDVLAADQRTLESLALTRAELVEPLEMLIQASVIVAFELGETLASYLSNEPEMQGARRKGRDAIENRFGKLEPMSSTPENAARLGGRYEIRVLSLRGSQPCPWSPAEFGPSCARSSTQWWLRDTTRNLEMSGPGLISHLITEHGFFEGFDSPYRVDPRALAELLQLGPFSAP